MRMVWLVLLFGCGEVLTPHSIKQFAGLCGSSNTVGDAKEGSADVMDNLVIRSRNVLEPRRGFKASTATTGPINALAFKESCAIGITYDTPSNTGALRYYNPATDAWTALPMNPGGMTLDRPGVGTARTRFVSVNKSLYFQSKYGLTKIETVASGVSRAALQPRPLTWDQNSLFSSSDSGYGINVNTGNATSSWLANNFSTGYRFTVLRKGANGEYIESEPSERLIVSNTSGIGVGTNIAINYGWMFPPDAVFRVWRDKQVGVGTDLAPEEFLVAEIPFGVGGLSSAGYATIPATGAFYLDNTPDTFLTVPLYTNAYSGGGIASQNNPSPLSADLAWFRSRMHHLNTSDVQRLTVRVIGTGAGGIQAGDTITVGPYTFRFVAPASVTSIGYELPVYTAGTIAANLEATARQMAAVISRKFANNTSSGAQIPQGLFASYLAAGAGDAGYVIIQSVVPGAQAFTFKTSSANGWDRDYTTAATSDPNAQLAGWMWSNFGQPEGVPTANNNPIGDTTAAGQRLIALKETLFAFKADGLWKITDDGSQLGPQLQLVDPTVRLIAPETAVALDNFILALDAQGVILITETGGVLNISHTQIERELFDLMAYVGSARLAEVAFGVANQPMHEYILALPESPNAASCSIQYVYNLQTQTWTRWTLPGLTSGAVNPDTGQLFFGRSDGTLWMERKSLDAADYQDPGFTISSPSTAITASLVFTGDLRTGSTPFAVGDIVQQWQAVNALARRVIAVAYNSTTNQTTLTLDSAPRYAWNQAVPLTIVKAIQCAPRFLPFTAGEPLTDKNWDNLYLSFRYCDMDFLSVGFASEKYPIASTAQERINNADGSANAPLTLETWGTGTWGSKIWGKQTKDLVLKCTLPQDFDHSSQLTLSLTLPCALSHFELNAIDLKISGGSDRVVR